MKLMQNSDVMDLYRNYPEHIRQKLMSLRNSIIETAKVTQDVEKLEETLKWGEPSYVTKSGSTLRVGWKEATSHKYYMYFNCRTILIDTFKYLYPGVLTFKGNRAIVFNEDDTPPVRILKHCIALSLRYHKLKHKPRLGL